MRAVIQQMAVESRNITITSIMGVVVGDTDTMVAGVATSTTNMLLAT
jgi:hypothetical protein